MPTITARVDAVIEAPAPLLLEILRDFRRHHPRILPAAFSDFRVVAGGYGDGTVLAFTTTLGGRRIPGGSKVTEPEPGVILERIVGREMVTEFRVVPNAVGAHVSIETAWTTPSGVAGLIERLVVPRLLRVVYREELELLAAYASDLGAASRGAPRFSVAPRSAAAAA